jgi:hypothetical protein
LKPPRVHLPPRPPRRLALVLAGSLACALGAAVPPIAVASLAACSSTLNLGSNDAGVAYDAACVPGTYTGTYQCSTAPGSLLVGSMGGPLVVTLVPAGATTLALTTDAALSATNSGAMFSSALSGVLDCRTGQLTGVVSQVTIMSPTFGGIVAGTGSLSATYDTEGGAPALVDGVIDPPPTVGATCTWTAQHP